MRKSLFVGPLFLCPRPAAAANEFIFGSPPRGQHELRVTGRKDGTGTNKKNGLNGSTISA